MSQGSPLGSPEWEKCGVFLSVLRTQVAFPWRISEVPVSEMLLAAALLGSTGENFHQLEVGHLVRAHLDLRYLKEQDSLGYSVCGPSPANPA